MSRYHEEDEFTRRQDHDQNDAMTGGESDSYYRESMTLLPPPSNTRTRSVPPQASVVVQRERSWSRSDSRSRSRSNSRSRDRDRGFFDRDGSRSSRSRSRKRAHTPLGRARDAVEDNFTSSTAGIGVGILGAVVGGFVANRASEAALQNRHKGRSRRHSDDNMPRLASTILGAVAGGLGANALTNHFEDKHEHTREREHAWGHHPGRDDRYDYRRSGDYNSRSQSRGIGYDREVDDYDNVYEDKRYERRRRSNDYRD